MCAVMTASTPRVDRIAEGNELSRIHTCAVCVELRQSHVTIDAGVAVTGKMLHCHQHAVAPDRSAHLR